MGSFHLYFGVQRPRLDLNSNESYRKNMILHGGLRGLHLDKVR